MSYHERMRPEGSPKELERRRQRALALSAEGLTTAVIALRVGATGRSVRRWKAEARRGGLRALAAKPASGRPTKLTPKQLRQLEKHLLKGARVAGFATELWTCPRIRLLIERQFGVQDHVAHVGRVLHALHWSPQRPLRRARERNEANVQYWVKRVWPRLKKKSPG